MHGAVAVVALVLAGCVQPSVVDCGDGTSCPGGFTCSEVFGCISPDQTSACRDLAAAAECTVPGLGDGLCVDGACIIARCGNARLEPPEACDDANIRDGDGCSSNCRSTEVCGNAIVDPIVLVDDVPVAAEQCDDGDGRSHDGCSTCILEEARWTSDNDTLILRSDVAIAYDAARGRTVMFGGIDEVENRLLDETWQWDGTAWRRSAPRRVPPARAGHALAYDAAREVIVLFGGPATGGDTWLWDGGNWIQQFPVRAPPSRFMTALAYDAVRGRTVLFGGIEDSTVFADTWEWDGETWHALEPAAAPSPRSRHALAYDPIRGKVVLFGGLAADQTELGDTWEWDGTTWSQIVTTTAPPARFNHALAYDPTLPGVVLCGGNLRSSTDTWSWDGTEWQQLSDTGPGGGGTALAFDLARERLVRHQRGDTAETWEWDGKAWVEIAVAPAPAPRFDHALAYDARRGVVVMFGGDNDQGAFTDTWEWNGESWSEQVPATSPPIRLGHAIAYDARRGRTVLYGGRVSAIVRSDTWEWDGTSWVDRQPASTPGPRHGHGLAYDATHDQTILFGGSTTALGLPTNETWIWNGTTWTMGPLASSPAPRSHPMMVHDPIRGGVLLIGGFVDTVTLDDVWLWDGVGWTELPISAPPRRQAGLAFDLARGHAVMFAGSRTKDTWELDATTFLSASPPSSPPEREGGALAYHAARRTTMSFGGIDSLPAFGDTWRFRHESTLPDESCLYGFDSDGDGLIGCADPDCIGYCDPICAIGGSCEAGDRPHCGDGVCSALETCRLCPGDCGNCTVRCGDFLCDPGETCPGDCSP